MNPLLDQLDTKALDKLMDKPMDRRQFLLYMGGVIVGLIGLKSLFDHILHQEKRPQPHHFELGAYGGGSYADKVQPKLGGGK